jgi:release factor glutamine methyltransferase
MLPTISSIFSQSPLDKLEIEMVLAHVLATTRAYVIAHHERVLDERVAVLVRQLIARRAAGEPMAYVLGAREFYGRNFRVSPATLIPRPETELLVEQALARLTGPKWPERRAGARVLDMGTGSGAIAVTLALESPASQITACDVSAAALEVAVQNSNALGARVEFVQSDWYSALGARTFDLIVSNPPYVAGSDPHLAQGDLRFEPPTALTDGSTDGLGSMRIIVGGAAAQLEPGGWLLFEHGYDQAGACQDLLLKGGFNNLICIRDLAGIDRVSGGQIR